LHGVSGGCSPFGRRCAASKSVENSHHTSTFSPFSYQKNSLTYSGLLTSVHDPSIAGPLEHPSWLPAASAKTNAQIIVDRFAAHRESTVHQENPLIAQNIWENCRPSLRGSYSVPMAMEMDSMAQQWSDTYALVCNTGVSIFSGGRPPSHVASKKLSELQKLCIVRLMRSTDGPFQQGSNSSQLHRDYIFSPTHSLHSELCMILQARYFLLLNGDSFTTESKLSPDDVVKEISFEEYTSRKTPWSSTEHRFGTSKCVSAHEVSFAPKGDHCANVSIWFDALPTELEKSQIKRSRRIKQKKKAQIRNEHSRPNANGALISRTSSVDFPSGPPDIDPFVPMLPFEDCDNVHRFIMAIIEHRIYSIIFNNNKEWESKLGWKMKKLEQTFIGEAKFLQKWTWPKREGMGRVTVTTKAPPGNIMPYIPPKTRSPCFHTWQTFRNTVEVLNKHPDHSLSGDDSSRLSVFLSLDGTIPLKNHSKTASLPHITFNGSAWWKAAERSSHKSHSTWKEIFLGIPENGEWETARRLHSKKSEGSPTKARNMPLSTIHFVQA